MKPRRSLTCDFCHQPIRVSKDSFDERHVLDDGRWHHQFWHTECRPYEVKVHVTLLPGKVRHE